jgi:hypothetical protein
LDTIYILALRKVFLLFVLEILDINCINEKQSEEYFKDLNAEGRITLIQETYDIEAEDLKTIPFDYYFPLSFGSRTILNLVVQITHVEIVKGIIFPTIEQKEFISKIDLKTM